MRRVIILAVGVVSWLAPVAAGTWRGDHVVVTTIDVPGSSRTRVSGMNDSGDVVGFFAGTGSNVNHAFLRTRDGVFSIIDPPGAVNAVAGGINNQGAIVGSYTPAGSSLMVGFLLRDGVYTDISVPGPTSTTPQDINERGEICGRYVDGGVQHGFTLIEGVYTTHDIPHEPGGTTFYTSFDLHRITRSGWMTGDVRDNRFSPLVVHGVAIDPHGEIAVFDVAGASVTLPRFMANSGEIVGAATIGGVQHGFYRDRFGNITLFDVPGADETRIAAGNNQGYVGGSYLLNGHDHGFVMK